jgi:hypothetical protein
LSRNTDFSHLATLCSSADFDFMATLAIIWLRSMKMELRKWTNWHKAKPNQNPIK